MGIVIDLQCLHITIRLQNKSTHKRKYYTLYYGLASASVGSLCYVLQLIMFIHATCIVAWMIIVLRIMIMALLFF